MVSRAEGILSGQQKQRLDAIQKTSRAIDEMTLRLATGQDVNSALDNPQNFFTARALNSQAKRLGSVHDGIINSIRTIQETEHGIEAIQKILDSSEAFLQERIEEFVDGYHLDFSNISDFLSYSGTQDPAGSTVNTINNGQGIVLDNGAWKRYAFDYVLTENTVLQFDYKSTNIPEISLIGFDTDNNYINNDEFFFLYGTQLTGFTYSAPIPTYQYDASGEWVTVSIPVGQYFTGSYSHMIFLADDDGGGDDGDAYFRNVSFVGDDITNGVSTLEADAETSFSEEYAGLREQIDTLAKDANYRGLNLLKEESLTTYLSPTATTSLKTDGIDATSGGLGLGDVNFNHLRSITDELDKVRQAREDLRRYASSLSIHYSVLETRDTFTQETINLLKAGSSDLTISDQNEDGANLLALQTRQSIQTSVVALSVPSILDFLT